MAITKENTRIGSAVVTWNSQDLGGLDAVEITIEGKTTQLKMESWGEQILDELQTAREATVKVSLKECNIEQLKNVFGDLTISGTTNKKVSITAGIGTSLYSLAQELTIHRTATPHNPMSSEHEKYTFPKAVPYGPITEKYTFSGYNVYEITFKVFVDISTGLICYRGYTSPS